MAPSDEDHYEHRYPTADALAAHPFEDLDFNRYTAEEMTVRANEFFELMQRRRSVRMLSSEPVPFDLIETAIATAGSAPSGAHQQPWTFVVIGDAELKRQIRQAAEAEEETNYAGGRMNEAWQQALAPLGTDANKEFLEKAPWLVVLFEQRYGLEDDGTRRHHYYVKESCGIAAGLFIAALHNAGLVTLTHTPSPMAFLSRLLKRPESERPFVLFPIGYPVDGAKVPSLKRKSIDEILTVVGNDNAN